jgi:hypothetical protein
MCHVPLHTESGIYLGYTTAIDIDVTRVKRTAERIVRGLFAAFFERVLPNTYTVSITLLDSLPDNNVLQDPSVVEGLKALGAHGKRRRFGTTLDVYYSATEEDINATSWWIALYDIFGVIGFTDVSPPT